jgi:hypothetical protein
MPATSALTTTSGTGLFSGASTFSTYDLIDDYVTIAGCSTYYDEGSSATIFLNYVQNIAEVMTTGTFQVSLYDSNNYKIA